MQANCFTILTKAAVTLITWCAAITHFLVMLSLCSCQTPAQTIILYSSALQLCCWVNNLGAVFHQNIIDAIALWWITLRLILLPPLMPEVNISRFSTLPLSINVIYHFFYWTTFSVRNLKLLSVTLITEQHQSVLHHSWNKTHLSKPWGWEMREC